MKLTEEDFNELKPYISMFWDCTTYDFTDPYLLKDHKLFKQILENQKKAEKWDYYENGEIATDREVKLGHENGQLKEEIIKLKRKLYEAKS